MEFFIRPHLFQQNYLVNRCVFKFTDVSFPEVLTVLPSITTYNKFTGPLGVSPTLLGGIASLTAEPQRHLINSSFWTSVFPDVFKTANVVPISKTTSARQPHDCRPISLHSNIARVFERVCQSQLLKHLHRYSTPSPRRSGFILANHANHFY